MPTLRRELILHSALFVVAALVAAWALACGGSGAVRRPAVPAPAAPRNVIAFGAQDGRAFGLYLVRPDGTDLRKLSDEQAAVSFLRWSPAGDRIAYVVGGGADAPATLRLYDFATNTAATLSEQAQTGDVGAPLSWSPDGSRLAFIEAASGGRLRVYDVKRGKLLDTTGVPALAVDWSPGGNTLAIVRSGSSAQQTEIDTVKPNGSGVKRIVGNEGLHGDPRWSPDAERLALWSAPSAQLTARTLSLRASNGDKLSELGPGLDPAWSTDGQLAYSRPASGTAGAPADIYVLAAIEGQPRLVTRASTLDRWPAWSPTGDAIAYLAQADRNTAFLCTVTLATEKQSCLDVGSLFPSLPAWSPF